MMKRKNLVNDNGTKTRAQSGRSARRKIALALQGGGSHGAFTWGVLDRLLEEPSIEIIGITGTSAGAMNTVAVADGLVRGGPEEARRRLREFWTTIGKMPGFGSLLPPMSGEEAAKTNVKSTPVYQAWDMLARNLSPYDLNPSKINPLAEPLNQLIDFERLRAQNEMVFMVCATNARTSMRRVFTNKEISVEAVTASACLPLMFPAVEIEGEPYWDGGYSGNPALMELFRSLPKEKFDLLFVRIDPISHADTPHTVREINDRITDIIFNSTLVLELTFFAAVSRLVDEGVLDRERFGRILYHGIEASDMMEQMSGSKLNNSMELLEYLFGLGRKTMDAWWAENGAAIGQRSTADIQRLLPGEFW
jgi:NTE family protein